MTDKDEKFGEGYFMRGPELGVSNYSNYRWLGEITLTFAICLSRYLGIKGGDRVLDVGCSRGFLVRALRMMGVFAFGYDISKWAIENCDPEVKGFVSNQLVADPMSIDWVILKDVCEHIEKNDLVELIQKLASATRNGMLIVVPLSAYTGGRYVRDEDEMDVTHIHRWTLSDWLLFLTENAPEFTVSGSYYIKGIKECCKAAKMSCGFFTLKRS